ncbi:MAG: hypothetical protein EOP06_00390 [Proteobacteria bacterium]|nr:MAG: hypothetical protein EOP06_00390 [Pseudomonadota bacterium]
MNQLSSMEIAERHLDKTIASKARAEKVLAFTDDEDIKLVALEAIESANCGIEMHHERYARNEDGSIGTTNAVRLYLYYLETALKDIALGALVWREDSLKIGEEVFQHESKDWGPKALAEAATLIKMVLSDYKASLSDVEVS